MVSMKLKEILASSSGNTFLASDRVRGTIKEKMVLLLSIQDISAFTKSEQMTSLGRIGAGIQTFNFVIPQAFLAAAPLPRHSALPPFPTNRCLYSHLSM